MEILLFQKCDGSRRRSQGHLQQFHGIELEVVYHLSKQIQNFKKTKKNKNKTRNKDMKLSLKEIMEFT